jgi:hypothetical protein
MNHIDGYLIINILIPSNMRLLCQFCMHDLMLNSYFFFAKYGGKLKKEEYFLSPYIDFDYPKLPSKSEINA